MVVVVEAEVEVEGEEGHQLNRTSTGPGPQTKINPTGGFARSPHVMYTGGSGRQELAVPSDSARSAPRAQHTEPGRRPHPPRLPGRRRCTDRTISKCTEQAAETCGRRSSSQDSTGD